MNSIGGSPRVREDLAHALEMGRKVTAKVQWLSKTAPRSRARWIHCTPLLGVNDAIGVWMVILVDDEDDRGERDLEPTPSEKRSQLRPHYTTEVLPWDTERRTSNIAGVSTSVWSETGKSLKKPRDETPRPKPRRPPFQQPTDVADPVLQTPFVARPGPSISGKAHSVNWLNGQGGSIDDLTGSPAPGLEARSTSQGSTITPIQSTMQPKIKIVGESGFPGDGARKRTINLPGRSNNDEDNGTVVRPLTRRTYKSLSPYGILFEE